MPTTTNLGLPYPAGADPADVPADMGSLAGAVDVPYGAWTAYTPAWTADTANPTIGNGTFTGRFNTRGKIGNAVIVVTIGTTTTLGTGAYRFSVPGAWTLQASANVGDVYGWGVFYDLSTTTRYVGSVGFQSVSTVRLYTHAATTGVSPTVPVVPATGDIITLRLYTELA